MEIAHRQESRCVRALEGHQQLARTLPVLGEQRLADLTQQVRSVGLGIVVDVTAAPKGGFVEIDQVIGHAAVHHRTDVTVAKRQRFVEVRRFPVVFHHLRPRQDRQERRQ